MQRELKFRVWGKKTLKMLYPSLIAISRIGACRVDFDTHFYPDECIIQQFTGLKDKNGKEIYEGDILKFKSFDSWNDKVGFYYNSQVFYCTPLARFRHSFKNFDNICGTDFDLKDEMEVIGNIFENPELCAK